MMKCKCKNEMELIYENEGMYWSIEIYWCNKCGKVYIIDDDGEEWKEII